MESEVESINQQLKKIASKWKAAWDGKKGKIYYYHRDSKQTQWHKPSELVDHDESEANSALQEQNEFFLNLQKEEERMKLLSQLSHKDSILDKDAVPIAQRLVKQYDTSPVTVLEHFSNSYHGYPNMCNLLADWTTYADHLTTVTDPKRPVSDKEPLTEDDLNTAGEKNMMECLSELTKRRFSKIAADDIHSKYSSNPEWLQLLLTDTTMQHTLLDLYKKNPESSFLKICCYEIQSNISA